MKEHSGQGIAVLAGVWSIAGGRLTIPSARWEEVDGASSGTRSGLGIGERLDPRSVKGSLTLFSLLRGGNHGLCIETERVRLTF